MKSEAALEYEHGLTRIARRVLTKALAAVDFTPLAKELGCHYVADTLFDQKAWHIAVPSPTNVECEPKVRRTLLKAMYWQLDRPVWHDSRGSSILSGLVQRERWRDCLKTEDGAYAFVALLLHWTLADDNKLLPAQCIELRRAVTNDVCTALDTWLPQATAWSGLPDPSRLLRLMFGEAWFDLVVGDADLKEKIASQVRQSRPHFLPGLLPAQEARSTSMPLPSLF